jgi:predicted PurR-regulated permease PerM
MSAGGHSRDDDTASGGAGQLPGRMPAPRSLRTERMLANALLGVLVLGCVWVLLPFGSALVWAVVLCFSTWGIYTQLRESLGGRRSLAALLMTLLQAVVIVVPVAVVVMGLRDHVDALERLLRHLTYKDIPGLPDWVVGLPLVGDEIHAQWDYLRTDSARLVELVRRQLGPMSSGLVDAGLAFGGGILQLLLSVLASFFLYRDGEFAAGELRTALQRIGGSRAERMVDLAGDTVRSVVYGLVGTALAQATLAALGFWVAGVPGAIFLGVLTFFSSPLPFGPPLVWAGASLWLYGQGDYLAAVGIFLWGLFFVSTIDNIIKPIIIGAGSRLPFMLVLLGVIGGVMGFGVIGVFLGPTLLALGYNLLLEWTRNSPHHGHARAPGEHHAAAHAHQAGTASHRGVDPEPDASPHSPDGATAAAAARSSSSGGAHRLIPDPGHDTEEPT